MEDRGYLLTHRDDLERVPLESFSGNALRSGLDVVWNVKKLRISNSERYEDLTERHILPVKVASFESQVLSRYGNVNCILRCSHVTIRILLVTVRWLSSSEGAVRVPPRPRSRVQFKRRTCQREQSVALRA